MSRSATLVLVAASALFFTACSSHMNPVQPPLPVQAPAAATQEQPKNGQIVPNADVMTPEEAPNPSATAGPTIYANDNSGRLWKVTLGTNTIRFVGYTEAYLTDIAFDPVNHALYGIDFNAFYRIDTTTGMATWVGYHGVPGANALVFDARGKAYVSGYLQSRLYAITNVSTGHATPIGTTGSYKSAGDLTFYNGSLIMSGYTGTFSSTTADSLVTISPSTGAVLHVTPTSLRILYGLASTGTNQLYGFASTSLYHLYPSATLVQNRAVLIKNFATYGIGQFYGAAYNGNFQL
jgi:hypothetical protein